jgi:pimeloyl-ACP methyl ester carboxylesterase
MHSWGGSSALMWADAVEERARFGRVIAYDRRGCTRSERAEPYERTSVAEQADDAAALLDALAAAPAVVIGRSYGGAVAIELALRYPDRVLGAGPAEESAASRLAVEEGQAIVAQGNSLLLGIRVLRRGRAQQADHAVARARNGRDQVHELAHRGMWTGRRLRDERASVWVAATEDRRLDPIEQLAHRSRVRVEVRSGAVLADRGQLDRYRLDPLSLEQGRHLGPHPGPCETAGHQHDP